MTKGNGRMKKIVTLVFVLLTLLTAAAPSAESYTQADFEWAEAVQDQSALTLKEQAKYLDIVKQRQRGIALLAMGGADTPFQIASAAQLAELAQYVNAGDATFVLGALCADRRREPVRIRQLDAASARSISPLRAFSTGRTTSSRG